MMVISPAAQGIGSFVRPRMSRLVPPAMAAAAAMLAALLVGAAQAAPAGHDDPQVLRIEDAAGQPTTTYGLERLKRDFPQRELDTRTPWTAAGESIRYRGPELKDVLAGNGLGDVPSIEASAYDDFVTTIRMDEIDTYKPILALERACSADDHKAGRCKDGEDFRPLTLDDSGPYSIIWPYDQLPSSYVPGRNSIWVWFVTALRPAS